MSGACDGCLRRAWLLDRLSGHLDCARARIEALLALDDADLLQATAGRATAQAERELVSFEAEHARNEAAESGLDLLCRCSPQYPRALLALAAPPAVLHIAGGLDRFLEMACAEPVAVVGARKASDYGLEIARTLGRGLAAAGVPVISGMALGVDSAAHVGALEVGGPTIAVLPGPASRAYPPARRRLHRAIVRAGVAVSELPPGAAVRRWSFPARNRTIAGLAAATVVVEAGESSGSLVTARLARALERPVGAVPGRLTSPLARGTNDLLVHGARLIRGPDDVLELLFGAGAATRTSALRPPLEPEPAAVLAAIAEGHPAAAAFARAGVGAERGLAVLSELELAGRLRRGPGGHLTVVP